MKKKFVPQIIFIILVSATYGFLSAKYELFPYGFIQSAAQGYSKIRKIFKLELPWYYVKTQRKQKVAILDKDKVSPGLTLISGIFADRQIEAKVVDFDGNDIYRWKLNWFDLWPDATHVHSDFKPISPPGTHVHGIVLMKNGDLVFNLERTGLYRVDPCGRTVWRVPRMTHHSVHLDEAGNFWVPGLDMPEDKNPDYPGYDLPYKDFKILKISELGEVVGEWSVMDLLKSNGLEGLLYLSSLKNRNPIVKGDTLHLNDIKTFPADMEEGVFSTGDVMVSLRNINMVIVLDKKLETVKHLFFGSFARQHDPDFIDGDTISLFDNNTFSKHSTSPYSRIMQLSAKDRAEKILFSGTEAQPFFASIMGKHQRLPNGNLLINEARSGRALEVDSKDQIVWEYINLVEDGVTGLMDEAQRLPAYFDRQFFARKFNECSQ